jgi:hypothetical protein
MHDSSKFQCSPSIWERVTRSAGCSDSKSFDRRQNSKKTKGDIPERYRSATKCIRTCSQTLHRHNIITIKRMKIPTPIKTFLFFSSKNLALASIISRRNAFISPRLLVLFRVFLSLAPSPGKKLARIQKQSVCRSAYPGTFVVTSHQRQFVDPTEKSSAGIRWDRANNSNMQIPGSAVAHSPNLQIHSSTNKEISCSIQPSPKLTEG